jgi:hypothetical protein
VWFIVAGFHTVPMLWQLPQVLPVIGAVVCVPGFPVAAVPLWHPVKQLVVLVTPLWVTVAGFHAVVRWQAEHCDAVLT